MTAGAINMASGKAQINADGSAVFTDVAVTGTLTSDGSSVINAGTVGGFTSASGGLTANNISIATGAVSHTGGNWSLNNDGSAKYADDRIRMEASGNLSIHGDSSSSRGIIIYNSYSSGSPTHTGNSWKIYNNGSNELGFLYNGTTRFKMSTGAVNLASGKTLWLGIGADADCGFERDGGHLKIYASTDGANVYPAVHSASTSSGYDLGELTAKWRRIYVRTEYVGDINMESDSGDAKWVLREKPDCILARNKNSGKTYKMDLTETNDFSDEVWEDD
jgi:hypothetical protein